jgi:hypothetical protein
VYLKWYGPEDEDEDEEDLPDDGFEWPDDDWPDEEDQVY